MLTTVEFRKLVDAAEPCIKEDEKSDLNALYRRVGLAANTSRLSRNDVIDHLRKQICECFGSRPHDIWSNCWWIRRQLVYDKICDSRTLQPYLGALESIQDMMRSSERSPLPSTGKDRWEDAVKLSLEILMINGGGREKTLEELHQLNNREYEIAAAVRRMLDRGFHVRTEDGRVSISSEQQELVSNAILEHMDGLGHVAFVCNMLDMIKGHYDPHLQRYLLTRRASTLPRVRRPQLPWNYLFHLAVKTPETVTKPPVDEQVAFDELLGLAADYAALFDVEPYNFAEVLLPGGRSLIERLQDQVVFDTLFAPVQVRTSDVVRILSGLCNEEFSACHRPSGLTGRALLDVIDAILKVSSPNDPPRVVLVKDIIGACQSFARSEHVVEALEQLTHPENEANADFKTPLQLPDFGFKPLLPHDQGKLLLLSPSLCSIGFIESALDFWRKLVPEFEKKAGEALETFLVNELTAHGVSCIRGKYKVGRDTYECDLVVETNETVLLFETKKKSLTRAARAGSEVGLLVDLTKSLLNMQVQMGRHEIQLRDTGHLDIDDPDRGMQRLDLRGRDVERIGITLLDYGSLQDRSWISSFMTCCLNAEFVGTTQKSQEKVEELNSVVRELREQYHELSKLDVRRVKLPFFHCWFFSVPQFLVLLDSVKSNDDLRSVLWKLRHVSYSTSDFYAEMAGNKRLHGETAREEIPNAVL